MTPPPLRRTAAALVLLLLLPLIRAAPVPAADPFAALRARIGPEDGVLLADETGKVVFSQNGDKPLIPASTLKIFTALVALHYLGPDYRFVTDLYMDKSGNLKVKGYGDPLLISEVIADMTRRAAGKIGGYRDMVLDTAHFADIRIPGVTTTLNPYDAPNGALCANFNTVYFRRSGGRLVSAEPQTPLLDFAAQRIKARRTPGGRIILSRKDDEVARYAGHLIRHFLEKSGVEGGAEVRMGRVDPAADRLVLRYPSPFPLTEVLSRLLEHSNNFIANQVLIAAGIAAFGPPGTLDKGLMAARGYSEEVLTLKGLQLAEGSGISRANRITARAMGRVLAAFAPHYRLMRREGNLYFKTGTLRGINTLAGYIVAADGTRYRFAVLVNTPGRSARRLAAGLAGLVEVLD
jgi:D-alanyl-D-alanine carboxypeptidase/D-alanyl-D-alanine-endopeptidase (penicillin-binding protein 4)